MGNKSARNYGIDLLRIYSMFLVVIIHTVGYGGAMKNSNGMANHMVSLLEIIAFGAVNIYALISGYVGYSQIHKKTKFSKYITIWSQVFCYSFGITACAFVINPSTVGIKQVVFSALPAVTLQYWYFSCYFALMLFMPLLNAMLRSLDNKALTVLIAILFGIFSVYSMFALWLTGQDPFTTGSGFTVAWLTVLYIMGVWIKRTDILAKVKSKTAALVIFCCVVVTWISRDFMPDFLRLDCLVNYISPLILIMAAAYLVIFSNFNFGEKTKQFIGFLSPAAFGVYLIHNNGYIREYVVKKLFAEIDYASWQIPVRVLVYAFIILVVGLVIELLRQYLFRILKINKLIDFLGAKIDELLCKTDVKLSKAVE